MDDKALDAWLSQHFAGKSREAINAEKKEVMLELERYEARSDLIKFMRRMMPDPEDPTDTTLSLYKAAKHHELLAEALHGVQKRERMRVAISIPPQHGKTRISSIGFIAWVIGNNPRTNIIFGCYNETYAQKIGGQVRDFIQSAEFFKIFPGVELKKGSQSKTEMETTAGGQINFIGRGGSGTGLPANLIIIDDPIKNAEEADSPAVIEELHEWYSKVIYTRARATTPIVIIQTRWCEDDLVGRLCDPDHPWRTQEAWRKEAARWDYINIPAVITPGKLADAMGVKLEKPTNPEIIAAFGDQPMRALWPEEFTLEHLATAKNLNPLGFDALYMGKPTPDDGEYFKREWIVEHSDPVEYPLPDRLRFYGASDHALSEKEDADATCMGIFGVDERNHIWVMPDVVWRKMQADSTLDEMIALMKARNPVMWFAEDEHINKTLGPFRRKRMQEEKVYTVVHGLTSTRDLRARARSIQGRMAMRMIHFPAWVPWWSQARAELLKFPHAKHDDFVSFMSLVGRGLDYEVGASAPAQNTSNVVPYRSGSIAWIKQRAKLEAEQKKAKGGW